LWRYFSWANQVRAAIALWIGTMYLFIIGKNYIVSFVSGLFMTYMVFVYILNAKIGFNLPLNISFIVGAVLTAILIVMFFVKAINNRIQWIDTYVDVSV